MVHRNFRLFWIGQTLSLIGTWMQVMAQGWLALELSNNAFLVGLVSAIGSLPILLFSLHAGVLVDRADRLKMVRIAQSLMLAEAAALWWFTWSGHVTIHWLIALAFLNGLFSAYEIPARQSLFIELVGREDLHEAIALNSSGFNLARIIGPAVGALVIARLGLAWCFGLNALSYLAVLVSLLMIRLPAWSPPAKTVSPLDGIREGLRYMLSTDTVRTIMGLVAVYAIFGIPYLTLMPVVARDRLGLGADGYGVLLAAVGIGGLAGALFLAAVGSRFRRGRLLFVSSILFPIMLIAFASLRSVSLAHLVLLGAGFFMIVNSALANGILQGTVPDMLRGRLMAAYSFVVVGLAQVVGSFLAGLVARVAGVSWAIGGMASLMLVFACWTYWRRPELQEL